MTRRWAGTFRRFVACTAVVAAWMIGWLVPAAAFAENQTDTLSPVVVGGKLPYRIAIRLYDFDAAERPTLHSFAAGHHDGQWVLIGGRTNGLHDLTAVGLGSFPTASQNREVWVVDPVHHQTWRKSLEHATAGLTVAQVDALTPTNAQFVQVGDRLYITGGYGYDRTLARFVTYDTLTAVDLPGLIDWVRDDDPMSPDTAAGHIRRIHSATFRVTGGGMHRIGDRVHLTFGQDFQGNYSPLKSGFYTFAVRSFRIVDDGVDLSIADAASSTPNDNYRRRDLNVIAVTRRDGVSGDLEQGIVALSGVFTPTNGAWTVPVEIDAAGTPTMADPASPDTFKQGLNGYHSAKVGLFSEATGHMHTVLFGGITFLYYDRQSGQFGTDAMLPFTNHVSSLVIDEQGRYAHHLLDEDFPVILDNTEDNRVLRFGANAEFFKAEGIEAYDNGVLKLDELTEPTVIGYIYGGIQADAPNGGRTAASGLIFEVVLTPVPRGDVNQDGVVDAADIDDLRDAILLDDALPRHDLNDDGQTNQADVDHLVRHILGTQHGDVNLDGRVNIADLATLATWFMSNDAGWAKGDLTGDHRVNITDLALMATYFGFTSP